ncbi:MAG: hypothetical protein WDW38_008952 [Sanguina aurantia]
MDPRPRSRPQLPQLDIAQSCLEAPAPWVASHLQALCSKQSSSLFSLVRDAHTQLVAGAFVPFSQAAGYSSMLSNFHASIVELDDALSEPDGCSTDRLTLSACRSWLHQLQTFVMALHRDIATITSVSATDEEATATLWRLFSHEAATLLQLVISSVPAESSQQPQQQQQEEEEDAEKKRPCGSHSSCEEPGGEDHIVQAVLHLPDSCLGDCSVQPRASVATPPDGSRGVALQLGVSGKSKVPLAALQQPPRLSKLVNKGSVMGYLQHWGKKPTV